MKKFALITLAAVLFSVVSCDTKDLLDIALDGKISKTFSIENSLASDSLGFDSALTFTLADNEEFAKYGEKIKSISITKISIEVDKVTVGEDNTAIEVKFATYLGSDAIEFGFDKVAIKQAETEGTVLVEYALSGEEAAAFGEHILSAGQGSFIVTGTLYNTPIDVDLKIDIEVSLTASPLD